MKNKIDNLLDDLNKLKTNSKIKSEKEKYLSDFVNKIMHGSNDHMNWLANAAINYMEGRDIDYNNPYKK